MPILVRAITVTEDVSTWEFADEEWAEAERFAATLLRTDDEIIAVEIERY